MVLTINNPLLVGREVSSLEVAVLISAPFRFSSRFVIGRLVEMDVILNEAGFGDGNVALISFISFEIVLRSWGDHCKSRGSNV